MRSRWPQQQHCLRQALLLAAVVGVCTLWVCDLCGKLSLCGPEFFDAAPMCAETCVTVNLCHKPSGCLVYLVCCCWTAHRLWLYLSVPACASLLAFFQRVMCVPSLVLSSRPIFCEHGLVGQCQSSVQATTPIRTCAAGCWQLICGATAAAAAAAFVYDGCPMAVTMT